MPTASPNTSAANIRAPSYFIAETRTRCRHCGGLTRVVALAVPRSHETGDGEDGPDVWHRAGANAFLFFIGDIPSAVQQRMMAVAPRFRLAQTAATLNSYWVNHCEACGALLSDHELHCEPEGAFVPVGAQAASQIHLLLIPESIQLVADGYTFEPEFFRSMSKS